MIIAVLILVFVQLLETHLPTLMADIINDGVMKGSKIRF